MQVVRYYLSLKGTIKLEIFMPLRLPRRDTQEDCSGLMRVYCCCCHSCGDSKHTTALLASFSFFVVVQYTLFSATSTNEKMSSDIQMWLWTASLGETASNADHYKANYKVCQGILFNRSLGGGLIDIRHYASGDKHCSYIRTQRN